MGKIMVTIVDTTNRETTVEVPDDKSVGSILDKLMTMLDLPRQGGRPLLFCKRTGKDLDDAKTLAEQGIQSYEVLRLRLEAVPGARRAYLRKQFSTASRPDISLAGRGSQEKARPAQFPVLPT